MIQSLSKW